MTPAARYASAIAILDTVLAGEPAERALTNWARSNRFAGSGDRAAIRDHVYDVLRARRSLGVAGGGDDGRALVLGLLRRDGIPVDTVFGAGGHAPAALTPQEAQVPAMDPSPAQAADLPDWLWPIWQASLGDQAMTCALTQQQRAGLHLRVNLSRATRQVEQDRLQAEGIATLPHPDVDTGLIVQDNPRRVAGSKPFADGVIEVQDAASQIAMAALPLSPGLRVLDLCAGGGGKALAMADRMQTPVFAHDIDPRRMTDIAPRAARAGVQIKTLTSQALQGAAPFDLVLVDAPCSGSGTWRRTPDAKWRLTPERLSELNRIQAEVIAQGAALCAPGGLLAYATCSVLQAENDAVVGTFVARNPDWHARPPLRLHPTKEHDGFYMVVLQRG
ncbi:RsmB/NOP family class I SAM-dependent RNA methyltransferase [Loktanella salsilacus]|uniref:RsmB/NOP family class I SAM-dependent RNA methyltransferase n=1 Tax=Loktanella salsilacus TaxID=195913 RepID=UPI0037365399